ncbi:hypothetical protein JCM11641_006379 [Rhodosporidiobolus odoratus]
MDIDSPFHSSPADNDPQESWQKTRAGKRIAELKEVEDNVAALLHFAGCTLASLHPEPLANFTPRELATDDGDEGEEGATGDKANAEGAGEDKAKEFAKYAEGYYAALNDIQLDLRTSIRHLRVSRVSPAPLLDPSFSSLSSSSGGVVGVGGVALEDLLKPLQADASEWNGGSNRVKEGAEKEQGGTKSVAALELEKEAWSEVVRLLEGSAFSTV